MAQPPPSAQLPPPAQPPHPAQPPPTAQPPPPVQQPPAGQQPPDGQQPLTRERFRELIGVSRIDYKEKQDKNKESETLQRPTNFLRRWRNKRATNTGLYRRICFEEQ